MVVARATQKRTGGPSESKSDLTGLKLRMVKKRKGTGPTARIIVGDPQLSAKKVLTVEEPSTKISKKVEDYDDG